MRPLYEATSQFLYTVTNAKPKVWPVTCKNFAKAFPWEEGTEWVPQQSDLPETGNWLWKIEMPFHTEDIKNARFVYVVEYD